MLWSPSRQQSPAVMHHINIGIFSTQPTHAHTLLMPVTRLFGDLVEAKGLSRVGGHELLLLLICKTIGMMNHLI